MWWVSYSLHAIVLQTGSGRGMFLPILVGALCWLTFFSGQMLQWNNPKPLAIHSVPLHTQINLSIPYLIRSYLIWWATNVRLLLYHCSMIRLFAPYCCVEACDELLIAGLDISLHIMSKEFRSSSHQLMLNLDLKSIYVGQKFKHLSNVWIVLKDTHSLSVVHFMKIANN